MSRPTLANPDEETLVGTGDPAPPTPAPEAPSRVRRGLRTGFDRRQLFLLGTFAVMVVVFVAASPDQFATWDNVRNGINDLTVLAILAMAVSVVLFFGEFDLAAPAIAALAVVTVGVLTTVSGLDAGLALVAAVVIVLLVGGGLGTASGAGVAYGKASSFIVTLAVSSVALGMELFMQARIGDGATSVNRIEFPTALLTLTDTRIAGFELTVILMVVIAVLLWLLLTRSVFGRYAQAIGGNEAAARLAGIPVERIKVAGFALAGTLAAVAGLVLAARSGYFSNAAAPYLLPAYAAAFFGAAAVGRRGFSIPATLFGVLYLQTLSNGLQALEQPLWVISVVQGAVLLVTVLLARGRTL